MTVSLLVLRLSVKGHRVELVRRKQPVEPASAHGAESTVLAPGLPIPGYREFLGAPSTRP